MSAREHLDRAAELVEFARPGLDTACQRALADALDCVITAVRESTPPAPTGQDEVVVKREVLALLQDLEEMSTRLSDEHKAGGNSSRADAHMHKAIAYNNAANAVAALSTPAPPEPDSIAAHGCDQTYTCAAMQHRPGCDALGSIPPTRVEPVTPTPDATGEPEVGAVVRDREGVEWRHVHADDDPARTYPWQLVDDEFSGGTWAGLLAQRGPLTVVSRPSPAQSAATDEETVERLCEVMHDAYEAAAVEQGWETQQRSRKPWADVPEANKATMRAAVRAVLAAIKAGRVAGVGVAR